MLDTQPQQAKSFKTRNEKGAKTEFIETPLNDNYMAVIRDSHACILSRHDL
jgi:hypothetical protein